MNVEREESRNRKGKWRNMFWLNAFKIKTDTKNITANLFLILFFTIIYFKHKAYAVMIRLKNKFVPVALRM